MRNKLTNEQNYLLWERGWTLQWVNLLSSNCAAQRPASRPALLCRHIFLQPHFLSPDWWLGGCWWQFKKYICVCVHAQLSLTLCDPTKSWHEWSRLDKSWHDCSPPGPSVHGILQQEYCSGLPFPPPGYLPNPGIELASPVSPALAGRFFTLCTTCEVP